MSTIESPSILEELSAVDRFFIFGDTDKSEKIQFILVGRYPGKFYGFLAGEPTNERHRASKFNLRYWKDALAGLEAGDLVFMPQRNKEVEAGLAAKGVRVARHHNLLSIYGTYEAPTLLHFCRTYIGEKGITLDIGGNTGLTGALLSKFSEHVHIFEANPAMEPLLHETNEGNKNITLHFKAVCEKTGRVNIYDVGPNNTSMVPKDKSNPIEVPSISVDDFCRENGVKPSLIKIDVEGVDSAVILGAKETIATHRPFLFFEHPFNMARTYDPKRDIIDQALAFLADHYDLFAFPHLDQFCPARALNMPLDEFRREFNIWPTNVAAVPRSRSASQ